jgi:hypothetical protein
VAELNVSASVLAVTFAVRPKDTRALRRFRPNVKALRPQDRRLASLRARTLKALDDAIAARRNPRRARRHAKAALASAAAITRGLRRYEHAHRGIRAVIPD